MRTRFAASIVALAAAFANAAVKPANLFSDGCVLQRDQPVAVWGTATPDAAITVAFNGKTADAKANASGKWKATFPAMPADATSHDLTVTGDGPPVVVRDVLVGDVWLCGGQSNMGYALDKASGGPEAIAASGDPLLRYVDVPVDFAPTTRPDVPGTWRAASPATSGAFSAVAYFFARDLRRTLGVPIGIVQNSVGGSPIIAWSRRATLDGIGSIKARVKADEAKAAAATRPYKQLTLLFTPGWLYNAQVAPLVGLGIKGFVWYQGESDVDFPAADYRTLFPRLIRDWRQQWGDPNLPFLFVQLSSRTGPDEPYGSSTADLRLAQTAALDLKFTGMATAIDTRAEDWHPADKLPVAKRLANLALKIAYGQDKTPTVGPVWIGRRFARNKVTLRFHSPGGLVAPADGPHGFAIAGDDRRFVPATATIVGKDRDTIELTAEGVDRPVAVRYGWTRGPVCDLTNTDGIPANPFRTDDWPTPTTRPEKP